MQKKLLRTFKISFLIGFVAVFAGLPSQTRAMIAELEQEAAIYRTKIGCRNCSVYVETKKSEIRGGPTILISYTAYDQTVMHFNSIQGCHADRNCTAQEDNARDFKELERIMLAVRKIESDKK